MVLNNVPRDEIALFARKVATVQKNCPDKYNITPQSSKICLKCGGSGHEMFSCLLMISRKYNATSARVLAIYVVLPLVLIVWDKFLATDVVNWVILVWSQLVVSSSHKPSLAVRIEASKARRSTDLKFFRPARNGSLSHQLSTGIKNFTRMFLVKNQATIMWSYDINLISWLDSALQGKSSALILTEQY
ncbi:hypothetical protein OIU77_015192 [Salix suchowensis]|uniref:CCHC-type domain-containing protein n=1 Tax=Salix suchowensis TaxID=1278906 RepID=A0ABQ8ZRZ1_9ROSI|nr:hypothetical protein OIU77_015192 [Salix suchowensis]